MLVFKNFGDMHSQLQAGPAQTSFSQHVLFRYIIGTDGVIVHAIKLERENLHAVARARVNCRLSIMAVSGQPV
jgi:hypothetical protein